MFYFIFLLLACFSCTDPKKEPVETAEAEWVAPWTSCQNSLQNHPCDFELVDQNGDTRSLYEFYGKPIILDFSAMWCGPCNQAAVDVQAIQDLYSSENLVYLTVLIENQYGAPPELSDIQSWATDYNITSAPVLAGSRSLLNNENPALGFFLEGWPTFYFIDKDMVLQSYMRGYSRQNIEIGINSLIGQPDGN